MMIVLTTTCTFTIVRNPQNKVRIKSGPSGLVFYWLTVLIAHDLYLLININICKYVLKEIFLFARMENDVSDLYTRERERERERDRERERVYFRFAKLSRHIGKCMS